jgi:type IV pilus assembly protein PilY1
VTQDGTTVSSTLWIGNAASATSSYFAVRFTGVNLPPKAKINSAVLNVTSTQDQWISIGVTMAGDATGNSLAFSGSNLPSSRTLTGSTVNYTNDISWKSGTAYDLDAISGVVQEVVNRNDWNSGNAVSLILKGIGTSWGRKFIASPKLTISYTTQ